MYSIVSINNQQYNVQKGDKILVNKLDKSVGDEVIIDKVLFISSSKGLLIGKPVIAGAKVNAEVINQTRGPKVIVFKKRSKKTYQKTIGHRDYLTELIIKEIVLPS